jgi:ergothioneine biosynthesis protein EgtB
MVFGAAHHPTREALASAFQAVRARTESLASPLSPEDQVLQSMPACSPTKWHRAHTTWFWETFLLGPVGVEPHDASWAPLFNSYYVQAGPRAPRPKRGMLSRPTVDQIAEYRRVVDARMQRLLLECTDAAFAAAAPLVELGIAHEEQHQELVLTDILNAFHDNPLRPSYRSDAHAPSSSPTTKAAFRRFDGGMFELGAEKTSSFRFDNEEPRHRVFVEPFELSERLVTVGEWSAFAEAGGYDNPALWLSDGFDWAKANDVSRPLYADRSAGSLLAFGLDGTRELHPSEPISHLSYYEADALARFLGARLPTEVEWELVAKATGRDPSKGNFESLRPRAFDGEPFSQLYGDVWEWTSSAYSPYPGFAPGAGAVGEYNGKFMANQMVLRGGSCLTPRGHVRATYRNFWHPDTRFQMTGLRLARSCT